MSHRGGIMNKSFIERIAVIIVGIFILCGISYALNLSRVKTWNASDVLTASDLNAEFDNIINHAIVNADISATAAIAGSKLDLAVAPAIGATTPAAGTFTTLSATGNTTLGNGADTLTINCSSGITYTPAATWTFTGAQTVSGTWANLGTVTTATINGGTITGITDLVVADGGTGVSTLTDGGILIGNGTGAIVATAVLADGEILVGDGTTDPVAESGATLRTSIGVAIGTDVQAYDADLDDLADGSLTGSKIGTGISGSNITTGTVGVAYGGTGQTTTGLAFGGKVVNYTGNGADDRNIAHGLGRTPIIVIIHKTNTDTLGPELWTTNMQATYSRDISNGAPGTDKIQSVDGTNVQVGTSAQVNANGVGYDMFVM